MDRKRRQTKGTIVTAVLLVACGFGRASADPIRLLETAPFFPGEGAGGYAIDGGQYVGVRFFLPSPVTTSSIGGQFGTDFPSVDVFASLIRLSGPMDLPDSTALDTPDVLDSTLIRVAPDVLRLNGDFAAPLNIKLESGWYAAVFGAGGVFGSSTAPLQAAASNGLTGPVSTWPFFLVRPTLGRFEELPNRELRFFIDGTGARATNPVPEAGSLFLLGTGLATVVARHWRRRGFRFQR